ncbi:MoaD/ThiS family protein [Microbacterium sp. NPDC077184]|uniref:MoaD/ThiS family protein n=1 Tax=Microbacterium sp. NPDC077184 TaxID=3154764 RepID=UPI00343C0DCA
MTRVRFFAAAQEAAGTDAADYDVATLGALRTELTAAHPALAGILPRCAVLLDGARVGDDTPLTGAQTVDVLPPFAGG